eukprot:5883346-Ditylum_brightwellii.AAC.1
MAVPPSTPLPPPPPPRDAVKANIFSLERRHQHHYHPLLDPRDAVKGLFSLERHHYHILLDPG